MCLYSFLDVYEYADTSAVMHTCASACGCVSIHINAFGREDSGRKVSGVVAPTKCSTRGEKANWVFSTEVGGRGIIFQGRLEGEKDRGTTTSRFPGEAG